MKLVGDAILLEFQKEEWESEKLKDIIKKPDIVAKKEEGEYQEKAPVHFFKVWAVGPECKFVKKGDRVLPRPPDLYHQGGMLPVILWEDGKPEMKYMMLESNLAGVE